MGKKGVETYGIDLSTIVEMNYDGSLSYDPEEITALLNSGTLK
jgi:hypothetical protein